MVVQNINITFAENINSMDRVDFCKMLISLREKSGIGKNEMCRMAGFTFNQLQLLENKPNNFSIDKVFVYLNTLNHVLVLDGEEYCVQIRNISDVSKWLKKARGVNFTQRSLATVIGCSYLTIANIERCANKISIDIFLKIAHVLNYTVKIESV